MAVTLFLLLATALVPVLAQEGESGRRLEITAVDRSDFPELGLNVIATDVQSRPLETLAGLRLRENGVPIADFGLEEVAVGLDLIFVLDAGVEPGSAAPASGWLQTVQDAILRFGGRYMEASRDEVSLLVAAREDGRWLVENKSDPGTLITALDGYEVPEDQEPQTLALLERALAAATAEDAPASTLTPLDPEARFQAIILFTSGIGLNRYLFPPLVEEARANGIPIFVVAYGLEPSPTTLETLTWLYRPTRGTFVHLAEPAAADDIYETLQANGIQRQLRYESNLRETGTYSVSVSLEQAQDHLLLDLELASPRVEVTWPERQIRRVGAGPETELTALQPAVQSVPVRVTWPGGTARDIVGARLLLDGERQPAQVTGSAPDLDFEWDIADLGEGDYTLTVQVTDTLGLTAESDPHPVSIAVVRPEPLPTATVLPTVPARGVTEAGGLAPQLRPQLRTLLQRSNLIAVGTGGVFLLIVAAVIVLRRRNPPPREPGEAAPATPAETLSARPVEYQAEAYLVLLSPSTAGPEHVTLPGANVLLGRDPDQVDIPLADSSVARLHARIRRRNGEYWLYDEGSASGTFLNFERLGLAPQPLATGDEIRLGRIRLRFYLPEVPGQLPEPKVD